MIARTVIFLLILAMPAPAVADADRTRALLELIGADAWIESFAEALGRADPEAAADQSHSWTQAAGEIFQPEAIFDDLVGRMDGQLTDAEVTEIMAFLNSDLGLRVTAMEVEAQNPDIADGVDMAGPVILKDLMADDPDRIAAYQRMMDAIGAVDAGVTGALNMNFAVLSGMSASGRMAYQLSDAEILTLLASQEATIRDRVAQSAMENAAFTYRDLSDADLDGYVAFLETAAGGRIYSLMNSATDDIMAERGRQFGARIVALEGTQEL